MFIHTYVCMYVHSYFRIFRRDATAPTICTERIDTKSSFQTVKYKCKSSVCNPPSPAPNPNHLHQFSQLHYLYVLYVSPKTPPPPPSLRDYLRQSETP